MVLIRIYSSAKKNLEEIIQWLNAYQVSSSNNEIYYSICFTRNELDTSIANTDLLIIHDSTEITTKEILSIKAKCPQSKILFITSNKSVLDTIDNVYVAHTKHDFMNILSKVTMHLDKSKKENTVLSLNAKAGHTTVPYDQIMYIELKQKRINVKLSDGSYVTSRSLRVSLGEYLEDLLKEKRFLRSHSAFVVNMDYVVKLEKNNFLMADKELVPIAKTRMSNVIPTYRQYVYGNKVINKELNPSVLYYNEHFKQLEYLSKQPIAQCIIRVDTDKNGKPNDFVFMYANELLCALEGKTYEELMGASFYQLFKNGDVKWLAYYYDSAYNGNHHHFKSYSREIGSNLEIQSYQVEKGYCGCILTRIK